MADYRSATIKNTLKNISEKKLVLPAIQRGFVWKEEQIERLFDSLMQGFPFSTLLYWEMSSEIQKSLPFYAFLEIADEQNDFHNTSLPRNKIAPNASGVIDGQQRLSALNIALKGGLRLREKGKRKNDKRSYKEKYLYLNILSGKNEDNVEEILESKTRYEFKFLSETERFTTHNTKEGKCWFRVSEILHISVQDIPDWFDDDSLNLDKPSSRTGRKILTELWNKIHNESVIWHYPIESSVPDDAVLEIFTRTNQGGTKLSKGDMVFSMAVSHWKKLDARKEIEELVSELNRICDTEKFDKDFILSVGIMISSAKSSQSRKRLMNAEIMQEMEDNWDLLKKTLMTTAYFLKEINISGKQLLSTNALLPLICWLYMCKAPKDFETKIQYEADRTKIKDFLFRCLAKGVWGSGANTLADKIRKCLKQWDRKREKKGKYEPFPLSKIEKVMSESSRSSLKFTEEDIEQLLQKQKKDAVSFFILSLIFEDKSSLEIQYDVDHIFPKAKATENELKKLNLNSIQIESIRSKIEEIPNLWLLQTNKNKSKSKKMPQTWIKEEKIKDYELKQSLIDNPPNNFLEFESWFDNRKAAMKQKLIEKLNVKKS